MTQRILCVEDNPQNLRLVRKILKHQGYEVLEAMDGTTGVRLAEEETPDLILMDVNLPDIDGLEATRQIKAKPDVKHIPIIALTANAMYGDAEKCIEAGCDGYVAKPVSRKGLLDAVTEHLNGKTTNTEMTSETDDEDETVEEPSKSVVESTD